MGAFVDWKQAIFSGLSNTTTVLITANPNYLVVQNINVTNKNKPGTQPIRITLLTTRTTATAPEVTTESIEEPIEFEIAASATVDILSGIPKTLEYLNTTPSVSDSLSIYSFGPTQFFNCSLNYMILKELPA